MKVLIIEDNPADVELIREILSDHREPVFDIVHAGTLTAGLSVLSGGEIDVILLDLGLPDSQGIDTVSVMRENNPAMPIVVLTGLDDDELGFRALQEGAQDYLVKGEMSSPLLVRSVRYAIERNRAEQDLRESEEKYRTLFESAGDSLLIHDLDGRLLDVNQVAAGRLGYSREELLAMNLMEIVPPEFAALVPDRIGKVAVIGHQVFETAHVTRDGRHIPIEASARVIPYRGGTAILSISRDITDRKQTEAALQESEERFRALIAASAQVLYRMSPDWSEMRQLQGGNFLADTVEPNRNWMQEYIHPDDQRQVLEVITGTVQAGTVFELEHRVLCADGTLGWTASRAVPVRNAAGEIVEWFGAASNITGRKRAEEALCRSEERFRLLTENSSDVVFILDEEGFISYVSPSVRQIGGYGPEELIGRNVLELTHPDDLLLVTTGLSTAQTCPGERITLEVRVRHRSGDWLYLDIIGVNLQEEPAIQGYVVNARDITERKQAEEALARHTEELVRKSREVEAARDEANMYLDIMTHDVRNANNVSSMYADLLAELADGDLKVYVEKLHASISRSSEILKNVATIRRVSEESTDRLVPVNLDAVIRDEIDNYPEGLIRYTGLEVDVIADGLLPTVCNNLLGNAVKFGDADVAITVRVEECDGEMLVSVEDTGPGILDEVKTRLFRRFERGTAGGSGQGLGLFIVRTLVERYGGRIWVEDRVPGRPEEGAVFRFTLIKA
jgi:PAS domain S-box-containing protein